MMHPKAISGFLCICFVFLSSNTYAQTQLSRISAVERSDGKGLVVRYHLSEAVDSFFVSQPAHDLIQMGIYDSEIDTSGIQLPPVSETIKDIGLYKLPNGYGVDIFLGESSWFTTRAYSDRNKRDLLLALTEAEPRRVQLITDQYQPVDWAAISLPDHALETEGISDVNYEYVKDKLRFDVVVIDPGHGGWEPGAIGYKGVKEKEITLAIAKKLGGYIQENIPDVKVVYTRDKDEYVSLEKRGEIANQAEGDLFISIHCNNFHDHRARGAEVYFLGLHRSNDAFRVMQKENSVVKYEDDDAKTELSEEDLIVYELANSGYISTSEKIAGMMEHQFDKRARRRSRGVKQAGFVVLYHASMPAVLVEAGFISNPSEQRFLTSDYGQSIIASAIYRAIRDYKVEYEKTHIANSTK